MSTLIETVGQIAKGVDTGQLGKWTGIIGTVAEAGGQIAGGVSASERSRSLAKAVMRRSVVEADLRRRKGGRLLSTQRARYAASGVEMMGSPLLVMDETIREAEADAAMIMLKGTEEAEAYKSAASGQFMEGLMAGGTTLLTRAGGLLKNTGKKTVPKQKRGYPGYPWAGLNLTEGAFP